MPGISRRAAIAAMAAGGLAACSKADPVAPAYSPTQASLNRHPLPDWFDDSKLGIFIHWGLYSVPGFAPKGKLEDVLKSDYERTMVKNPYSEDYMNAMRDPTTPTAAFHREHYGSMPYSGFKPMFDEGLKQWDPEAWASEFKDAGAGYVVLTAKYADGYCLWPTKLKNPRIKGWDSERDVVGELADAVRRQGMRFGVYFSGGLDWSLQDEPQRTLGEYIKGTPGGNFPQYSEGQLRELIELYKLDILWNDITWCNTQEKLFKLFADYYNVIPDGVVNDRFSTVDPATAALRPVEAKAIDAAIRERLKTSDSFFDADRPQPPHCDFTTPEWVQFDEIRPKKWEVCRGLGTSWGYNRMETEADFIKGEDLLFNLIDAVSKNGNMLLNVGPRGIDAQIPDEQLSRLRTLGAWLKPNSDAIHGSRPWRQAEAKTADDLPVRLTQKGDALNVIVWGRPVGDSIRLRNLSATAEGRLLADGSSVKATQDGADTVLTFERPLSGELAPAVMLPGAARAGQAS